MMFNPLLLAAAGEWLSALIPIVFMVIYVLNYLLSANKNNAPPQRPNQQRRVPPAPERHVRPAAGGPKQQADQQSQLNAEIEQFLKRANERRSERARRENSAAGRPAASTPPAPPRSLREQPVDIEPIERRDFSSVAASVEKHLDNRGFAERAEHLTDDVARADQMMEEHLRQAFNRRVGTLGDTDPATSPTPTNDMAPQVSPDRTPVSAWAAMLSNPESLKRVMILNEILQRPVDRW